MSAEEIARGSRPPNGARRVRVKMRDGTIRQGFVGDFQWGRANPERCTILEWEVVEWHDWTPEAEHAAQIYAAERYRISEGPSKDDALVELLNLVVRTALRRMGGDEG